MASPKIFEVSIGRLLAYVDNVVAGSPANAGLILAYYKAIEADTLLLARTDKADVDIEAANTECDFDNYTGPLVLSTVTAGITSTEAWASCDDEVITAAGSATSGVNNDIKVGIIFYTPDTTGSFTTAIPLAVYEFVVTTSGIDLRFKVPTSGIIRLGR